MKIQISHYLFESIDMRIHESSYVDDDFKVSWSKTPKTFTDHRVSFDLQDNFLFSFLGELNQEYGFISDRICEGRGDLLDYHYHNAIIRLFNKINDYYTEITNGKWFIFYGKIKAIPKRLKR